MRFEAKKEVRRLAIVLLGATLMAVNIKIFVRAGGLVPGGMTGLTVLLQRLATLFWGVSLPYTPVNLALNAIPVYIGFRFIGKKFTLYSLLVIVVEGFLTDLFPSMAVTDDMLLISVFGGILSGTGVSLCLLADATSGGTDFIAIYLSQRRGIETWNLMLGFNAVLLLIAAYFFGWEKSLYSIIYQYVSTQVLRLLYHAYQRQTLLIVTTKPQEICDEIHHLCHHGATILEAEGSHTHSNLKIVYSVVSREDVNRTIVAARRIDPSAFINAMDSKQVSGRFYMRPRD